MTITVINLYIPPNRLARAKYSVKHLQEFTKELIIRRPGTNLIVSGDFNLWEQPIECLKNVSGTEKTWQRCNIMTR